MKCFVNFHEVGALLLYGKIISVIALPVICEDELDTIDFHNSWPHNIFELALEKEFMNPVAFF